MDNRRQVLVKNKRIATGLMAGAALLFVIARLQGGAGAWEWVAAFAEAAMVGALADWFAVVALFRHPLGIPIPHTAIVTSKQETIAGNLARFIRDRFLASETLVTKLREFDPAERLACWFTSGEQAAGVARGLTRLLSESLDFLDDERVQILLRAAVSNRIERFDLSTAAGALLEALCNQNRHQAVLDDLLNRLASWIGTEGAQAKLGTAIDDMITREYPLLSHFIPNREQFSRGVGEKIARKLNEFVQEVNGDGNHEIRHRFSGMVADFIDRLKHDRNLRDRIEAVKVETLHNQVVADYVSALGNDLKNWLEHDLVQPDSRVRERITEMVVGLGTTLCTSRELKQSLNEHLEKLLVGYGDTLRTGIAGHIATTVRQWDTEEYVNEIELSIGSDLQFIRMNGTLVGGVIGLLLHAVSLLLA